jgi:ubiquitin carboxyl-terminal hydrolase 2/21
MSELTPYNIEFIPNGQGFINLGNTCYFNSFIQCLLSCSSIYEALNKNKDKLNTLTKKLLNLWNKALNDQDTSRDAIPIWNEIIRISQNQRNRIKMDNGQQDSHEALMMFLDAIENIPMLRILFDHRHRIVIDCDKCNQTVVDKKENNSVFEVQSDLRTEQIEKFKDKDPYFNKSMELNDFLKKQYGYVDENFICPNCKQKGEKIKKTVLTLVPEILPIVIKKYKNTNSVMKFPEKLHFISKNITIYNYELVAQSEHSGGMGGGHYWAICKRKNGWLLLNDNSHPRQESPGPTPNTYLLFYHFINEKSI